MQRVRWGTELTVVERNLLRANLRNELTDRANAALRVDTSAFLACREWREIVVAAREAFMSIILSRTTGRPQEAIDVMTQHINVIRDNINTPEAASTGTLDWIATPLPPALPVCPDSNDTTPFDPYEPERIVGCLYQMFAELVQATDEQSATTALESLRDGERYSRLRELRGPFIRAARQAGLTYADAEAPYRAIEETAMKIQSHVSRIALPDDLSLLPQIWERFYGHSPTRRPQRPLGRSEVLNEVARDVNAAGNGLHRIAEQINCAISFQNDMRHHTTRDDERESERNARRKWDDTTRFTETRPDTPEALREECLTWFKLLDSKGWRLKTVAEGQGIVDRLWCALDTMGGGSPRPLEPEIPEGSEAAILGELVMQDADVQEQSKKEKALRRAIRSVVEWCEMQTPTGGPKASQSAAGVTGNGKAETRTGKANGVGRKRLAESSEPKQINKVNLYKRVLVLLDSRTETEKALLPTLKQDDEIGRLAKEIEKPIVLMVPNAARKLLRAAKRARELNPNTYPRKAEPATK